MYWNSHRIRIMPAILLFFFISGCGIISLEMVEYSTYPEKRNQTISREARIWIEFSIPPDREQAEASFTLLRKGVPVEGDYTWEKNRLFFTPVPPLKPGVRYLLAFAGDIVSAAGERHPVNTSVPFFVDGSGPAPVLLQSSPPPGEVCGTRRRLQFLFSTPLDESSLLQGFHLTPERRLLFSLKADKMTVTVSPEVDWEPHTVYTWEFTEKVTALDGTPLGGAYTGTFVTQADTVPPSVRGVSSAAYLAGVFLDQPGFGKDDLIRLKFSEKVDLQSLRDAFSISPPVAGRFERCSEKEIIFFPDAPFTMNMEYHLTIDTGLRDEGGNYLKEVYWFSFIPDIPEQHVESVRFIETEPIIELSGDRLCSQEFPVIGLAGAEPDFSQTLEIIFARPYEEPYRSRITCSITCTAYFPERVFDPELEVASWDGTGTRLLLKYRGFKKSPAETGAVLYRVSIPGGKTTTENQDGSYLTDETWIVFQTVSED
jgi:hypothetical protein